MKIKIEFNVDIDPVVWAREYGLELHEVRADVKKYVRYGVMAQLEDYWNKEES
jgi:hypothetical protein